MGLRKSDPPERRKLALMRRSKSETNTTHTIGGVERRYAQREKPSLPKMPWDESTDDVGTAGGSDA